MPSEVTRRAPAGLEPAPDKAAARWRRRAARLGLDALMSTGLLMAVGLLGFSQVVPAGPGALLVGMILAGHALAGRYLLREGAGLGWRLACAAAGTALAAGAAALFFGRLALPRSIVVTFLGVDGIALGLLLALRPGVERQKGLAGASLAAISLFHLFSFLLRGGSLGAGDGYWYSLVASDFVGQWRAGVFPVFAGATEYAFNGAILPYRFAPLILHEAGLLDLLTGRLFSPLTLLNSVLFLSAAGGFLGAYYSARQILPASPWTATGLALLYIASPAVLGLFYTGALFMSATALPFVPLVWLAVWRSTDLDRPLSAAACAAPLAAAWLGHPPIALWLHVMLAGALAFRWARLGRAPGRVAGEAAGIGLLFAALAGFAFVSALTAGPAEVHGVREVSLANVVNSFPAMLKPVSASATLISDYQPGLALWILLAAALACWLARVREFRSGVLLAGAGAMMILLLPVPLLTAAIWRHLPQLVIDATYFWPMQRLAVIFAGLAVLAVAGVWRQLRPGPAAIAGALLWLGVGWSQLEAENFLRHGASMFTASAPARKNLAPNNVMLTRYAFGHFPAVPAYYSHGYVDPVIEHRVLSADGRRPLLTNRDAVLKSAPVVSTLRAEFDGVQIVVLTPPSPLAPGARHYYRLEWLCPPPVAGSVVIMTRSLARIYDLPDTGIGMKYQTQSRAYGLLPGNTDGFPVWIRSGPPEALAIDLALTERPKTAPTGDYLRLSDYSYRPEDLPIQVRSLAPYRVTLQSPEPGLLETPRMFLDGYRATVNGKSVDVRRSEDGLVAVPVPGGSSEVTLAYVGRAWLRFSYWLSLLSWTGLGAWAGLAWWRRSRS
ncbi:MAG TPA: hypothetical protein VG838_12065 [Opitutaceae bacterium]|nr:hypothetical protein [Opitutaceae bacterium]